MFLKKITRLVLLKIFIIVCVVSGMSQDTLIFDIQKKSGIQGSTVCLDVTAKNFKDIESIQFNLSYNATLVVPQCPATNIHPMLRGSIFGDLFNCQSKDNGFLRFVWASSPTSIPDGEVLFTLCFELKGDPGNVSPVSINGVILDVEVCRLISGKTNCKAPFMSNPGSITITSTTLELITSYCETVGGKGSITFYGTGGNPPYSYTVNTNEFLGSGIQDAQRVSYADLPPKLYSVKITDASGGMITKNISLLDTLFLKYNKTFKDPTCSYLKTGLIKLNTQPHPLGINYTYEWSNLVSGVGLDSLKDIPTGKYFVTITTHTGCKILDSVELKREPINMSLKLLTPAPCSQSGVFGFVEVNASGGTPKKVGDPYRIIINGGNNFSINPPYTLGQRAGKYSITVTDSLVCFANDSITIPFESTPDMTAATQDIQCKGANNGSAVITVSPYSRDYTYFGMNALSITALGSSNPRSDTIKLSDLKPGQYRIRALHSINNCKDTVMFTINEPQDSLKLNTAIVQPGCNVLGSINVNASGGSGPYNYIWNPAQSPGTTSLTNLTGGSYRVTVTDSKNCIDTFAITLNTQGALAVTSAISKPISCPGKNDAKLKATPSGGTAPYTYEWKNSSGQTLSLTDSLVNIGPGVYSVQVNDKDGCKSRPDTIIVSNPVSFTTIKGTSVPARCYLSNDGIATIMVAGGNTGYTFEWQRLGNTQILGRDTMLRDSAGTYIVKSINASGCSVTDTLIITAPAAINVNPTVIQPKCDTLGTISLNPTGGVPGYKYIWNTAAIDTLNNIKNLDSGNYQVTVTDANGCNSTFSQSLNPSGRPQINATSTNITCFGANNGTLSVNINSPNGPFDISWKDSFGNNAGNTQTVTGRGPGMYSVIVTDKNKCSSITQTVSITQPDSIAYTKNITNALCFQDEGSATIRVSGGNSGYNFEWKNLSNQIIGRDSTIRLRAGKYTVVIANTGNCPKTDTITITEPTKVAFSKPDTIDVRCFGQSNGRAAIFNSPPNLNYTWSNGTTGPFVVDLPKGRHWVSAVNNNGCKSDTVYFNIGEPPKIYLDQTKNIISNPKCFGQNNGSLSVVAQGGTGNNFSYRWSNSRNGDFIDNLSQGKFLVTITDGAGCTGIDSITLESPQELRVVKNNAISKNPDCVNLTGGSTGFTISGGNSGQKLITWQSGISSTSEIANGLKAGSYCATITDSQGCTAIFCDTLTQALKEVKLTTRLTKPVTCNSGKDGGLAVTISGNNAPYNVSWKNANGVEVSNDTIALGIPAGRYTVLVKELNPEGCQNTDTIEIQEPPKIIIDTLTIDRRKVTCFGGTNGQAEVKSGVTGLTYTWSSGTVAAFATNLPAGRNWVMAKDSKNCTSDTTYFTTDAFDILSIDDLNTQLVNVSCFGLVNGSARIVAIGGTGFSYTYRWENGSTTAERNDLAAGVYKVTISDSNNCIQTDSIAISQPSVLVSSLDLSKSVELDCKGTEAGRIGIKTTGGNPGIKTISWQSGVTVDNGVAIGLKAGNYCATVSDNFGCKDTFCYTLKTPPPVFGEINNPQPPACNGGKTCISVKSISGGTGNKYTFQINNGRRFPVDTCVTVTAGQYFISFIDSTGCSVDTIVTINQPEPISVNLGPDIEMNLGQEPVQIKVDINSAFRIDTVIWTPKSSLNCLTPDCITVETKPVTNTTYLATVIDENGCKGSDEINVTIRNIRNVYFPNIFTPNRDGFNDYFQAVIGPGVERILAFSIYDRWGNMVFDKSDFVPDPAGTDGWDGTYNGVRLDPGVFVYFAKARFIDGREIQYSGSVTLADKVRN